MSTKPKKRRSTARKQKLTEAAPIDPSTQALLNLIAANVRRLRKERGWLQKDLEPKGFDVRYLRRVEAGQRVISVDYIARLAEVFEVQAFELFHN